MKKQYKGVLEIDTDRGVIYFHDEDSGACVLRVCRLPTPIPVAKEAKVPLVRTGVKPWKDSVLPRMLDINHLHGCDWGNNN